MNTLTKGALSMVLAGSVTFSVANTLLGDQSYIRLAEENASTIAEDPKKADIINQAEKTVKDQTPATSGTAEQPNLASNDAPIQVALNNQKESVVAIAAIPQNNKEITEGTTPKPINTNQTTTSTPSAPSTPVPTLPTTPVPAPVPAPAPAPPPTTTTGNNDTSAANYGQEVAQVAKEKAESHQENKGNNGKKN
ncbi:hypothetical protein ABC255_26765 [Neobacillus sp. 3P2-tot-E-2]|uniref:hypothetical protein n=1 Tax=Neobacillus sp. 3P2-tot-E-2 TaxID=3132212 RepID=UPI00399F737F